MTATLRSYLVVTGGYWAFTITDGAIRVLVLLHPNASVAVSVTSNEVVTTPVSKTWLGFDASTDVPLPKSQVNSSACVLTLLNCTAKGEHPAFTSTVKSAVGWGLMYTVVDADPMHPLVVSASKETVAVIKPSPSLCQTWLAFCPVAEVPSPKFHVMF